MSTLEAIVYERGTTTKLGSGPLRVLRARLTRAIDRLGTFEFDVPADDRQHALLTHGREVSLWRAGSGEIWRGIIDGRDWEVDEAGAGVLTISGTSLAVELQWENTYSGIILDDETIGNSIDAVLAQTTGWTDKTTGSNFVNVTRRLDHRTLWKALQDLALIENAYLRETSTNREIEMIQDTTASGITLVGGRGVTAPIAGPAASYGVINGLPSVHEEGVRGNRMVMYGLKSGNFTFDMGESNRSSPYTIQSFKQNRPTLVASDSRAVDTGGESRFQLTDINVIGSDLFAFVFVVPLDAGAPAPNRVAFNGKPGSFWGSTSITGPRVSSVFVSQASENGGADSAGKALPLDQGAMTIEIEWDTAPDPTDQYWAIYLVFQDVKRSGPIKGWNTNTGTGTTASVSVSQSGDGDLGLLATFAASTFSVSGHGSGQTNIEETSRISIDVKDHDSATLTGSFTFAASEDWACWGFVLLATSTYYIEDSTSVTAYGRRVLDVIDQGEKMSGASATQIQNAANALYDRAVTELQRGKDPVTFYTVSVGALGDDSWLVGDSMRVVYRGIAQQPSGKLTWLSIDATLKVVEATQELGEDGARRWTLTLASVYRLPGSDVEIFGSLAERTERLEAAR